MTCNATDDTGIATAKRHSLHSHSRQLLAFSRSTKSSATAFLFLSASAVAEESTRPVYVPPPNVVNSGSIVQIIFSLLLVLAAIIAVAWVLKRSNLARQGSGNQLKIIGGISVGQRERVVLVEVLDSWLVVGVGPGQIRTLHVLDKPGDGAQQENLAAARQDGTSSGFSALFARVRKQRSGDGSADAA